MSPCCSGLRGNSSPVQSIVDRHALFQMVCGNLLVCKCRLSCLCKCGAQSQSICACRGRPLQICVLAMHKTEARSCRTGSPKDSSCVRFAFGDCKAALGMQRTLSGAFAESQLTPDSLADSRVHAERVTPLARC